MAIEITARSLADTQPGEMSPDKVVQPGDLSGLPGKSVSVSRLFRRSLRWTRRNFSSRATLLSGGEVVVLSAPKSGRTWIRTFLCAYLCKRHGLEFTLQPGRYDHPGFPRVIFSHDRFEHWTKGNRWDRFRGKYLVPRRQLRRAKIICAAGVEVHRVAFALQNIDISKTGHFFAGLPGHSSQQTSSMGTACPPSQRLRRDSPRKLSGLEARGVEPLSSPLSAQTSTCLSDDQF